MMLQSRRPPAPLPARSGHSGTDITGASNGGKLIRKLPLDAIAGAITPRPMRLLKKEKLGHAESPLSTFKIGQRCPKYQNDCGLAITLGIKQISDRYAVADTARTSQSRRPASSHIGSMPCPMNTNSVRCVSKARQTVPPVTCSRPCTP